jgi:hypothetical protein
MKASMYPKSLAAICLLSLGAVLSLTTSQAQQPAAPQHAFFHIALDNSFNKPVSGRLLLFI